MPGEPILDNPTGWVAKHIRQYVETDGRRGHQYMGWNTLLLTTRGRTSGTLRRTALIYGEDADRLILVASNGGAAQHPNWYLNLVAHPEVGVQVQADRFPATARTADPDERARLWPLMAAINPAYDAYQRRADREIPVVILERAG